MGMGGDLILLPDNNEIGLEADVIKSPAVLRDWIVENEGFAWQTDGGDLLHTEFSAWGRVNRWLPPDYSQVTKIAVSYSATFRRPGATQRFNIAKTASVSFLSPTYYEKFQNGRIEGFEIGEYPDPMDPKVFSKYNASESEWPKKHPSIYARPRSFYKVTRENIDIRISRTLSLRFFAMDYDWLRAGFPQYIALAPRLVQKIEDLLDVCHEFGLKVDHFTPIYGFRSPAFNLGTLQRDGSYSLKAPFSQHQYGRAADLIVDQDGDLAMDDLNHDGKIDMWDAGELMKCVNVLDRRYRAQGKIEMVGGAGMYSRHDFVERKVQSPYVHMDVRGFLREDGAFIRWADPLHWPNGDSILWGEIYPKGFVRANGRP